MYIDDRLFEKVSSRKQRMFVNSPKGSTIKELEVFELYLDRSTNQCWLGVGNVDVSFFASPITDANSPIDPFEILEKKK